MFGLAGAAAASLAPLDASGAAFGPFQFVAGRKRIAFKLAGKERWVIDTRRFGGSPELKVERQANLLRVELLNARYPGTNLPADLVCELRRGVVGWRMHLRMVLGSFESWTPFEAWLAGETSARSSVQADQLVCRLGASSRLALAGRAEARFSPNWVLRLSGRGIARLRGLGGAAAADSVDVALLSPGDPSLLCQPEPKRTLLAMNRGRARWPFRPQVQSPEGAELIASDTPFDVIRVETGESNAGEACGALVADSSRADATFTFRPGGNLKGSEGERFELPLRNARYALAFDGPEEQAALVADYDSSPVWAHLDGCSFLVGAPKGNSPFELHTSNSVLSGLRCEPALLRVSAPLPDAVAEAGPVPAGAQLAFLLGPSQRVKQPNLGEIRISKERGFTIGQIQNFSISVVRPDDLLTLSFEFINLRLVTGGGPARLVRTDPNQPAYLVVHFPPQHIAEEVFYEAEQPTPLPPNAEPPINSRLAGASRLAFLIPGTVQEIPYTLQALLDWSQYEQSVTVLATPPPPPVQLIRLAPQQRTVVEPRVEVIQKSPQYYQMLQAPAPPEPQPRGKEKKPKGKAREPEMRLEPSRVIGIAQIYQVQEPAPFQTAIEAPYRLILSPNYYAGWAHARLPVEHGGRTELWHTRLGVRTQDGKVDESADYYRTLRAVWATDYRPGCLPQMDSYAPFTLWTLSNKDRYQIVRLSSDINMTGRDGRYTPHPLQTSRLMLSPLGAWMNVYGSWQDAPTDVPEPACTNAQRNFTFNLVEWRNIAAMGRDQYVRVVKRGFLFPFGHRAVKIEITERKFNRTPSTNQVAAYLRKRIYIVVQEFTKNYPAVGQPYSQGPRLPFQTVRITTLKTPALDPPENSAVLGTQAFWPRVNKSDFQFHLVGTDWEGRTSDFTAPLIFVEADAARDGARVSSIGQSYNHDPDEFRRRRPLYGQKVAFAKNKEPGDTTFETNTITLTYDPPEPNWANNLPSTQAAFYPATAESEVRVATVEQLTGTQATTRIGYHDTYLTQGLDSLANKGQVFAKLLDQVPLMFGGSGASADKAGGLLTPTMNITGLSRILGPVAGDLGNMVAGKFNPADVFQDALNAKLLGDISLKDVISSVADFSGALEKVPKFVSSRLPDSIVTTFKWQPDIQSLPNPDPKSPDNLFVANDTHGLTVDAKLVKKLDASPPTYEIKGALKDFEIHLVPGILEVLVLAFDEITFTSSSGKKPDVNVNLKSLDFVGPLAFINTLKDVIPLSGFKDPPSLDVTAEGVEMGYSLGLPPVGVGVFSLSNITLGAQLNLYFTGKPIAFQFNFAEEQHPFLLTVSLFGGGGFFGLELTPQGLQRVEGSFEFGGNFSLNLGVASGGVYVMAGLYYKLENDNTTLKGYLKCGGSVEVLAIITVSVEFDMSLEYQSAGNQVWGRATLTVEVKVLFFSKSVDLTVERQFAGGGGEHADLLLGGDVAPPPLAPVPVTFADTMDASDWQAYCTAFA